MDWLYALGIFVGTVATAFLLAWTERNVKGIPARAFIWVGSILVLFALGYGLEKTWHFCLLFLLIALGSLAHIPSWVFYIGGIGIICFALWYLFNLLGSAVIELAQEIAETRERIIRMEDSLRDKLDDIASRLPDGD